MSTESYFDYHFLEDHHLIDLTPRLEVKEPLNLAELIARDSVRIMEYGLHEWLPSEDSPVIIPDDKYQELPDISISLGSPQPIQNEAEYQQLKHQWQQMFTDALANYNPVAWVIAHDVLDSVFGMDKRQINSLVRKNRINLK